MHKLFFLLFLLVFTSPAFAISQDEFNKLMDGYLNQDTNVEKIGTSLEKLMIKKRQEYFAQQEAEEKKAIEEQFKNPVKVDIGNAPSMGNPNAPITIVEFSDFQCPFCKRGATIIDEVVKKNGDKVRLVFKNFPLNSHPEAKPAAIAAIAAGKQGKFWEMYNKLFDNQESLASDAYPKFANEIGIDVTKFQADFADASTAKQVEADYEQAISLKLQGTPGFFINGVFVNGAKSPESFQEIIDRWLKQGK